MQSSFRGLGTDFPVIIFLARGSLLQLTSVVGDVSCECFASVATTFQSARAGSRIARFCFRHVESGSRFAVQSVGLTVELEIKLTVLASLLRFNWRLVEHQGILVTDDRKCSLVSLAGREENNFDRIESFPLFGTIALSCNCWCGGRILERSLCSRLRPCVSL